MLVSLATACSGDDTGQSTDAAGLAFWGVDEQPPLVLGLEERSPDHLFQRVADATYLDDRAIAVLDAGRREVRVFDSDGHLVWVAGGHGEGPGEFSWDVSELRRNPDGTIAVSHGDNRAVAVFDSTGAYSHSDRFEVENPLQPVTTLHPPFENGSAAVVHRPVTFLPDEPGFERHTQTLTVTIHRADSIEARFEFPEVERYTMLGDGRPIGGNLPFAHVPSVAVGGKFIAAGIHPDSITVISPEGERRHIPVKLERAPVGEAELEQLLSRYGMTRSEHEEALGGISIPESTPRFDHLVVDSRDRIWVRQYSVGEATTWEVLDSTGSRLARVQLPPDARVLDAREDEVLLFHKTDLDVEYVARWSLTEIAEGERQ